MKKKICPILSGNYENKKINYPMLVRCSENNCAFWINYKNNSGRCAITEIAVRLGDLS